jgi:hypothetical protein
MLLLNSSVLLCESIFVFAPALSSPSLHVGRDDTHFGKSFSAIHHPNAFTYPDIADHAQMSLSTQVQFPLMKVPDALYLVELYWSRRLLTNIAVPARIALCRTKRAVR